MIICGIAVFRHAVHLKYQPQSRIVEHCRSACRYIFQCAYIKGAVQLGNRIGNIHYDSAWVGKRIDAHAQCAVPANLNDISVGAAVMSNCNIADRYAFECNRQLGFIRTLRNGVVLFPC